MTADPDSTPDHGGLRNTPMDHSGGVEGVPVTISYTPVPCADAAQCQARATAVFNRKQIPWVRPENGTLDAHLDVITACPSGALRASVGNQRPQHMTTGDGAIAVGRTGPYHVTNMALAAAFSGAGASRAKSSLRRCGLSKSRPYCDGSHHDAAWSDADTDGAGTPVQKELIA